MQNSKKIHAWAQMQVPLYDITQTDVASHLQMHLNDVLRSDLKSFILKIT